MILSTINVCHIGTATAFSVHVTNSGEQSGILNTVFVTIMVTTFLIGICLLCLSVYKGNITSNKILSPHKQSPYGIIEKERNGERERGGGVGGKSAQCY